MSNGFFNKSQLLISSQIVRIIAFVFSAILISTHFGYYKTPSLKSQSHCNFSLYNFSFSFCIASKSELLTMKVGLRMNSRSQCALYFTSQLAHTHTHTQALSFSLPILFLFLRRVASRNTARSNRRFEKEIQFYL